MKPKPQHQIQMVAIDRVLTYGRNSKNHDARQVEALAKTIKEFGWDQPIVVDGDMVIIKGHGRRLAALKLGLTEVPVIIRTDLTPAQVRAARIADNKVAEGGHDEAILAAEINSLLDDTNNEFDLGLLSMDAAELSRLMPKTPAIEIVATETEAVAAVAPKAKKYVITISCDTPEEREQLFARLAEQGYSCSKKK